MSYYYLFNRRQLLEKAHDITIKVVKKNLLSIIKKKQKNAKKEKKTGIDQ